MKTAAVIHWKTNFAQGVRCFSDRRYAERRVLRAGGSLADLREASPGCFVYWPPGMGAFPNAATLRQWTQEYDARPIEPTLEQRVAALESTRV